MSWRERLAALWHGKVWVGVWSGQTQPPIAVWCAKTVIQPVPVNPDKAARL